MLCIFLSRGALGCWANTFIGSPGALLFHFPSEFFRGPGAGCPKVSSIQGNVLIYCRTGTILYGSGSQTLASLRITWRGCQKRRVLGSTSGVSDLVQDGTEESEFPPSSPGTLMLLFWGPQSEMHLPTDIYREIFQMVSGCCKCQICAEKVNKQQFGAYLNKRLDGIHQGEAESLANFEELLESYPFCHLYVIIPLFSTTHGHLWTIWYYDRTNKQETVLGLL